MNKSMNISGMTYNDLKAGYEALMVSINEQMEKCREYEQAIINKKEEVMREFARAYMAVKEIGVTEEEMEAFLDKESATAEVCGQEPPTLPEPIQEENVTLVEEEDSTNPENNEEEENKVETASIWDNPALTAPYNPVAAKKSEAPAAPEKTPEENSDEELSSLEDLLSDDPEYKAFYHPATPVKKNHRSLPTLDELLSGEPINRILCQGNLEPKGAAYRQHSRVCHADGIIPTETATGQTLVYIPPAPSMAA